MLPEEAPKKICTRCSEAKELDKFHKNKARSSGLESKCKACRSINGKKWRESEVNRRRAIAASLAWHQANRDRAIARMAERHRQKPEDGTLRTRRWRDRNPEGMTAKNARRRARLAFVEGTHTLSEIRTLLASQGHMCANCDADLRDTKKNLDHFMPLARGGSNGIANLQWLCQPCNNKKHAHDPYEWLSRQGKLSLLPADLKQRTQNAA